MKNIFNIAIVLISILLMTGCSFSKKPTPSHDKVMKNKIPTWYTNPKKDTNRFFYSTTEGINKDDAIALALKDIISRLSVSVESSFSTQTNISHGLKDEYSKTIKSNVLVEVPKLDLNNYKVINQKKIKYNKYLVEVQIDRIKLANYLKSKLNDNFEKYKLEEKNTQNENILFKAISYGKLYNKAKNSIVKLYIIKELDRGFNIQKYLNKINYYLDKKLELESSVIFKLDYTKADIKFSDVVKKYLISNNFKITNSNKYNIELSLKVNSNILNSRVGKLIVYNINITLYDMKKQIVGQNIFELKEFYNSKFTNIKRKNTRMSLKLYDKIKEMSLAEFFTLK